MDLALKATTAAPGEAASARPLRFRLTLERREDGGFVEDLLDEAFGPGRFAKASERVREGSVRRLDLCWCVWGGARRVGGVRAWPIVVGPSPGVFLGPVAVAQDMRLRGLGALLIERVCEAAVDAGDAFVLLMGAPSFFEPLGFESVCKGTVWMPGPFDPKRLLWRALRPGAVESVSGEAAPPPLPRHAHRLAS